MKNRNNAIHDVKEFINTFNVGDEVYVINSWKGKPHSIGLVKIEQILTLDDPTKSLHGEWRVRVENSQYDNWRFVADMVNNLHGCFTNQADALAEFTQRLAEQCGCHDESKNASYWDSYYNYK